MKIRLFAILLCTVIAGVSCIHEFPVTDHSFDFTGEIIYDSETDQHRLTLTCKKKSATDQFDIVFHVDGENVITLTDMDGVTHQGWFSESFADTYSRTYILSEAPVGKHLLDMTISTEGFCQSIEIEYEVTRQKYELHSEVSTSGAECSSLLISLSDGDPRYPYSVEVELDGKGIATFDIDFTKKPIYTMTLPEGLRPGKHSVTLYVSDSMTGKQYTTEFQEPVRYKYLDVTLSHDKSSGYHVAKFGANPYSVSINIRADLEIQGKCAYFPSDAEEDFWWRDYHYDYITLTDGRSISESEGSKTINILDRDSLADKVTSSYKTSYIWTTISTPGGGEDSGTDYSFISGTEPAYYKITSESLKIDIGAEAVKGVTLRVTNSIGKMTLNGKDSVSGTISIAL